MLHACSLAPMPYAPVRACHIRLGAHQQFSALGCGLTQLGTTLRGRSTLPTFDVCCQLADSEISSRAAPALALPGAYTTGPQGPQLRAPSFAVRISQLT